MDIKGYFLAAWNIYIKNIVTVLIALLITAGLSIITLGVLYLPLIVGVQMLFVNAKRGKKIDFKDIFGPIQRYFSLTFGGLGIAILVLFGCLLLIVPGLAWASWWLFALLFIYDKEMHIEEGMRASKELVRKNGTWWHLLLLALIVVANILISSLIGQVSDLAANLVSFFFVMPLTMGTIACAYVAESQ